VAITPFRRVRSADNVIRQLQDATDTVFKDISDRQIVDGNILEGIEITGGTPKVIDHKLGRELIGWQVVRKNVTTDIWDSQDTNATPILNLILNATNTVTISLWVF